MRARGHAPSCAFWPGGIVIIEFSRSSRSGDHAGPQQYRTYLGSFVGKEKRKSLTQNPA